jgi:hypothetical protein
MGSSWRASWSRRPIPVGGRRGDHQYMTSTAHDSQDRTIPRHVPTIGVGFVDGEHGREALRAAYALTNALGGHLRILDVQGEPQLRVERELEGVARHLRRSDHGRGRDLRRRGRGDRDPRVGERRCAVLRVPRSGAVRGAVLGSVSRRVSAEARCAVVVRRQRGVRHTQRHLPLHHPGGSLAGNEPLPTSSTRSSVTAGTGARIWSDDGFSSACARTERPSSAAGWSLSAMAPTFAS